MEISGQPYNSSLKKALRGFTLIELMIVVAIIAILATVAIPKFADMVRKSKEAKTKGNLGALRSAITIYYSRNLYYPFMLESLAYDGVYIHTVPSAWTAEYGDSSNVLNGP